MSTLTIRLPDDTAQRLKSLAKSWGLSWRRRWRTVLVPMYRLYGNSATVFKLS